LHRTRTSWRRPRSAPTHGLVRDRVREGEREREREGEARERHQVTRPVCFEPPVTHRQTTNNLDANPNPEPPTHNVQGQQGRVGSLAREGVRLLEGRRRLALRLARGRRVRGQSCRFAGCPPRPHFFTRPWKMIRYFHATDALSYTILCLASMKVRGTKVYTKSYRIGPAVAGTALRDGRHGVGSTALRDGWRGVAAISKDS